MRPIRVTQSGPGQSQVIPIDQYLNPTDIGLGVNIVGVVTDVSIEHTFDDVWDENFNPATATWYPHPTLVNLSADADGNYAFPPTACRINQAAGAGDTILSVIQAGAVS
jgi:hypothetical protein